MHAYINVNADDDCCDDDEISLHSFCQESSLNKLSRIFVVFFGVCVLLCSFFDRNVQDAQNIAIYTRIVERKQTKFQQIGCLSKLDAM